MQKKVKVALPAFLRLAREKSVGQGRGGAWRGPCGLRHSEPGPLHKKL
jgi:hypothetical protein